jgi:hypothetical protein
VNVSRTRRTRLVEDYSDESGQPKWALKKLRGGGRRREKCRDQIHRAQRSHGLEKLERTIQTRIRKEHAL